jgi:hypothetical protein
MIMGEPVDGGHITDVAIFTVTETDIMTAIVVTQEDIMTIIGIVTGIIE